MTKRFQALQKVSSFGNHGINLINPQAVLEFRRKKRITTLCHFQSPQWSSSWPLLAAAPTHTEQPSIWRMSTQPLSFRLYVRCFEKWSLSTSKWFDSTQIQKNVGQTVEHCWFTKGWRHTKRFVNHLESWDSTNRLIAKTASQRRIQSFNFQSR